jgi:D-glycero-alpha-D-manno-heptose 1-phosphate guanylyltransferase
MPVTEAIILAGGLGTRLRDAVPDLPKCMAPVNGHPFIAYVIKQLQSQGISRFIFSLGYRSEAFTRFINETLPDGSYELVVEKEPLGTGGAIRFVMSHAVTEDIVVVNGDSIFASDIASQYDLHRQRKAACTLALKPMKNFDRYGVVEMDPDQRIVHFREKQAYANGLINGGVYIINKAQFTAISFPDKFSFETEYLQKYYKKEPIYGIEQEGYFIDIGIPEDYQRAQKELVY